MFCFQVGFIQINPFSSSVFPFIVIYWRFSVLKTPYSLFIKKGIVTVKYGYKLRENGENIKSFFYSNYPYINNNSSKAIFQVLSLFTIFFISNYRYNDSR